MTRALYSRIDAIERFAADVAHELKNPLTSLRSAVETLPLARTDESRKRLLSVIQHDVRRLDRLISDISDASRLDAELARAEAEPVDRSEEHTSELQSRQYLVCRLLLEKKRGWRAPVGGSVCHTGEPSCHASGRPGSQRRRPAVERAQRCAAVLHPAGQRLCHPATALPG